MASQVQGGEHVAHHFENADQQYQAAKLGMWVFLVTEVLFFGGLFCAYVIYRVNHPEVFVYAHQFLDKNLGALNTVILICSSFTMAWAVRAAQLKQRSVLQLMLALTLLFAFAFLGVKGVEYSHKWKHGLLWASRYAPETVSHDASGSDTDVNKSDGEESAPPQSAEPVPAAVDQSSIAPAASGPSGLAKPRPEPGHDGAGEAPVKAKLFFSIYFLMTGLHGIHVVGGIICMLWLMLRARRGDFDGGHFVAVDMVGLYWHLVDLIWIYLFLLLYLIH